MGITYSEMMAKIKAGKDNKYKTRLGSTHKWNYGEPYKMICLEFTESGDENKITVCFGFKVDDEYVEITRTFNTEGKGSFFWDNFIQNAFPGVSDEMTLNDLLGRPFTAEITKNEGFDNINVLKGYEGNYPEEAEGL